MPGLLSDPVSSAGLYDDIATAIQPMPRIAIHEVADQHRWMPSDTAVPGKHDSGLMPWVRQIEDWLHPDDPCQIAINEWAAQTGKSAIGENWIMAVAGGYYPGRMLVALDTLDNARDWSKDSLNTMISLSPLLRDRIRDSTARAKNETMLGKFFPGGRLRIVGMHSASAVCRMAAKYCWLDEVDRAKDNPGYEGNVVQLVIARQSTFGASRKLLLTSTPTIEGASEVDAWFLKGDQCYFHVPCPICGEMQPLEFEDRDNREIRRFIWDKGDTSSARYRCAACGKEWQEQEKNRIMPSGVWVPSRPELSNHGLIHSTNLNALYSPSGMVSWPQLVTEWIDANAAYKANGDPKDLTAYVNIRKAKTFAPPGDALDRHALADRVDETLDVDRIPDAIEAVTGGTDVQHECLYSVTLGVGAGFELWILDANRIDRCPEDAWVEHDTLVNRRFTRAGGGVSVPRRWCVDAGDGGMMSKILEYTDPRFGRGVYGIKGDAAKATDGAIWEAKIKGSKRSDRTRGRWFTVHVTEAKNDLFGYLSNPGPGPRSVHIAAHILNRYPDFLEQLTAEQRVREPGGRWVWENPKKRDNHWWDALVYALAAAHSIKLAYPQMFRMPVAPAVAATPATQPAPSPSPTVRDTPPPRQPARRGAARSTSADWLSRRRGGRF